MTKYSKPINAPVSPVGVSLLLSNDSAIELLKDTTLLIVDVSHGSLKVFALFWDAYQESSFFVECHKHQEGSAHKQRTVGKQFLLPDTSRPDKIR